MAEFPGERVTEDTRSTLAPTAAYEARLVLRAARSACLATSDAGQPFASLITPATAADGSVLMLLSGLSPHTRHLRSEPRCSVLVMGAAAGPNPQTAPRLSVIGAAAPEPDPALKQRWVSLHPYAAFYADLGDFQLWRMRPAGGQFVGGFARAHRLGAAELAPDPAAIAAISEAEGRIIAHCNADHAPAMDRIAASCGGAGTGWRMVCCDPDGCDLALDESVIRVPWSTPAADAAAVRTELVRLASAAHNPVATGSGPGV